MSTLKVLIFILCLNIISTKKKGLGKMVMSNEYYPWGGEFTPCNSKGCIGVVILNLEYKPSEEIAIHGFLKTENIGIEKIVANVISNPNIRFLIICGEDIRGHRSGKSLIALGEKGIDDQNRIIDAPGAIPYIENISLEAINRFRDQVEIVDMIDIVDKKVLDEKINECISKNPGSFGEPYIAIRIKPVATVGLEDKRVCLFA